MKTKWIFLLLLIISSTIFLACRSPDKTRNYTFTLNDSLWVQKRTIDSTVKVPYSYLPLVILPDKMKDGEKIEKKKDQANLSIEKKGDSIFIVASCDSLKLVVRGIEETLTRVRKENGDLKEVVKAAPKRVTWFIYGFGAAVLIFAFIYIIHLIKKK